MEFTDELQQLEIENQRRIEGWWDLIGEEPRYPCESSTVVKLCRAVEYAADNDRILQFTNEGLIPPVDRENGRLAWSATSIVAFSAALEARRMWQPFSKIHAHKFTLAEKLCQMADRENAEPFTDLSHFDVEGLLAAAVQVCGDPGAVQFVIEALRTKLKREGVL